LVTKLANNSSINFTIPFISKELFKFQFSKRIESGIEGTLYDTFWDTTTSGKVFSSAFGIPIKKAMDALTISRRIITKNNYPVIIALRFVKGTKSLLGFTKYPLTCILEFDGVVFTKQKTMMDSIVRGLKAESIPFTFHVGKMNTYGSTRSLLEYSHGEDLKKWKNIRRKYLTKEEYRFFSSEYSDAIGLDDQGFISNPNIIT